MDILAEFLRIARLRSDLCNSYKKTVYNSQKRLASEIFRKSLYRGHLQIATHLLRPVGVRFLEVSLYSFFVVVFIVFSIYPFIVQLIVKAYAEAATGGLQLY